MAQARRIKRKPTGKSKARKPSALRTLPWGLMLVILVSGVVIGVLISGSQNEQSQFGQGLKALFEPWQQATPEAPEKATPESNQPRLTQAEFDYYEVLPKIEEVMPSNTDAPLATRDEQRYFLQAASFRRQADADTLRAQLALQGLVAKSEAQNVADKGVYYRVRLGPFANRREAKVARTKLEKMGYDPLLLRARDPQ